MKLEQKVNSKENNFDFLRFVAASSVIVSHTYPLLGLNEPVIGSYNTLGGLAVSVFFIISGFLITKSWYSNPKISIFFKKRVLRIFPAMIAAILFGLFIIGPLVTSFNIKDFFSNPETWSYLKNVFLFSNQYSLPGVFTHNPIPMIVNGPLWTLPIEFFMYISISI